MERESKFILKYYKELPAFKSVKDSKRMFKKLKEIDNETKNNN